MCDWAARAETDLCLLRDQLRASTQPLDTGEQQDRVADGTVLS